MKLFIAARDRDSKHLRAIEILPESDVAAAVMDRDEWRSNGFEAEIFFGEDLNDVIRSEPHWFEEA